MTRYQRKALLAQEKRDDARADTCLRLGKRARPYSGETPRDAQPKYQPAYTMGEWSTRWTRGRVESRGGKLKLVAAREKDDRETFKLPEGPDAQAAPSFPRKTNASAIDWRSEKHVATALVNRAASMPRAEGT